jgi:hypothetical protein
MTNQATKHPIVFLYPLSDYNTSTSTTPLRRHHSYTVFVSRHLSLLTRHQKILHHSKRGVLNLESFGVDGTEGFSDSVVGRDPQGSYWNTLNM